MGLKNKKILITCGPTWVPIDAVRVISNTSSGTLGQTCAKTCQGQGARVTLLEGPGTGTMALTGIRRVKFHFLDELEGLLRKELPNKYDIVIHAAAVSDFKLKRPFSGKISSKSKKMTLTLVPTKKLINLIKKISPGSFLVGFKLEPRYHRSQLLKDAQKLLKESQCDAVVANVLNPGYQAFIVYKDGETTAPVKSRLKLVQHLIQGVETRL
ncbi:MAG: phosphopantothenoylcysteine decarboxylase [Candidatus Omnitrophota bacterium]|jgi:phosphopantothenoylcysteine decarboxylase/phosphopantothenate--cysteine ligase